MLSQRQRWRLLSNNTSSWNLKAPASDYFRDNSPVLYDIVAQTESTTEIRFIINSDEGRWLYWRWELSICAVFILHVT
jgi:hypothetical protein